MYVAFTKQPAELDLIDAQSGSVQKTIALDKSGVRVMEVMDYAIHPQLPVTYVTIKHDIHVPRFRILVVDELTGKVDAPKDAIGTWVEVDPSGRYLYAGYKDIYTKGVEFHVNPNWNLVEIPQYGNIDWVISYELRDGKPFVQQVDSKAGGNGSGIAMSPDGKRITYFSHVGTPQFSGNLVGWNTRDFKDPPVTYPTKGKAGTQMLAFHPSLNLVAAYSGTSPVLFDRETGDLVENKLILTTKGLGDAKVEQMLFSPDGKSLILVCSETDAGRYLRKVELRIAASERATVAKGVPKVVENSGKKADGSSSGVVTANKNLVKVKRTDIDALKPPTTNATLSSAEIGKRFMNSVVVVQSDESVGTGFVVGRHGFVLTCAHVVPTRGVIKVLYNTVTDGTKKSVSVDAKLVRIDPDRDLALLTINPVGLLTAVSLAKAEGAVDAGENVTVIGNPVLGSEILNHSVTTGVVSSLERELDGQKYVQTSAPVNGGNSGGPVFGAKGHVVGLVVSKARLEATAFAVPVGALRQFLSDATDSAK